MSAGNGRAVGNLDDFIEKASAGLICPRHEPSAERVNDFETPMHINLVSMDRAFSSACSPAWVG